MQEALENTLAELVAIPSDTNNPVACHQVIEYAHRQLEPLGLHTTINKDGDHPWLMATTQATKQPRLLLVAHLDVVAAKSEHYKLRIVRDKLHGRGVWDMKYAAAVYIEFLKAHKNSLKQYDLGVLFTTDEEAGGLDGVYDVLQKGWRADVALIPDYRDGWMIEENAKGVLIQRFTANGLSSHSSRPWDANNPISTLMNIAQELQQLYPSKEMLLPTVSITQMSGGQALSQIPSNASIVVDFRAFDPADMALYQATVADLAEQHGLIIEPLTVGPPHVLNKRHPLVRAYAASLKANDITPVYQKSLGATDARWFAQKNIPCIVTGPSGHGAHSEDEWIKRADLGMFYLILDEYATRTAKMPKAVTAHLAGVHA